MSKLAVVKCIPEKHLECSKEILKNIENHNWVYLAPPKDQTKIPTSSTLPEGEGIIISSGGSTGGPNFCLQSIQNLTSSALATGQWLKNQVHYSQFTTFTPYKWLHALVEISHLAITISLDFTFINA